MTEATRQEVETDKQTLKSGKTLVELWLSKIERACEDEKDWRRVADDAIEIYEAGDKSDTAFNILNSNVETLLPSVYNSTPVPDVRRRFGDADPIAKQVVDLTERLLSYSVDQYDFDTEMKAHIRDALVAGRGTMRVRYFPHMEDEQVSYQETKSERVHWKDFIRGPGKSWPRVKWIAFRHQLTRDDLKMLNPTLGAKIDLCQGDDDKDEQSDVTATGVMKTAECYEIWDKTTRKVVWIAENHKDEVLTTIDDPLQLQDFFPVPKPLQSMHRITSLVPICPYKVFKPLIDELDVVTKRISKLVKQLKVRGLYFGEMESDFETVKALEDGQFASAKNGAQFAAGAGGIDKAVWTWPMEPTVKALQQLYVQREQIKQTIYEVTGISDIVRGASNSNETATAQQIKNQWGSLRIQQFQADIAATARALFRMKAEIFSRFYSEQNIQMMTSLPNQQKPEEVQTWPQVMQLFKSEVSSFRIDIETDSTVRADMTRNQEQMNNFLQGTGQFAQAVAGLVQGMPQYAQQSLPVLVEVYTAFARKFKLGKQAEDALDSLSSIAQQLKQAPPQDKPDPEQQKMAAEMQMAQQKAQLDSQALQAKLQAEMQSKQIDAQHQQTMAQLAERKAQLDLQVKQAELEIKRQELQLKAQSMQMDAEAKAQEMAMKSEEMNMSRQDRMVNRQMDMEDRESEREHAAASNEIKIDGMKQAAKAKARPEARA